MFCRICRVNSSRVGESLEISSGLWFKVFSISGSSDSYVSSAFSIMSRNNSFGREPPRFFSTALTTSSSLLCRRYSCRDASHFTNTIYVYIYTHTYLYTSVKVPISVHVSSHLYADITKKEKKTLWAHTFHVILA